MTIWRVGAAISTKSRGLKRDLWIINDKMMKNEQQTLLFVYYLRKHYDSMNGFAGIAKPPVESRSLHPKSTPY